MNIEYCLITVFFVRRRYTCTYNSNKHAEAYILNKPQKKCIESMSQQVFLLRKGCCFIELGGKAPLFILNSLFFFYLK